MLRVPQHERKNINDIISPPFVLSDGEGLLGVFQQLLVTRADNTGPLEFAYLAVAAANAMEDFHGMLA